MDLLGLLPAVATTVAEGIARLIWRRHASPPVSDYGAISVRADSQDTQSGAVDATPDPARSPSPFRGPQLRAARAVLILSAACLATAVAAVVLRSGRIVALGAGSGCIFTLLAGLFLRRRAHGIEGRMQALRRWTPAEGEAWRTLFEMAGIGCLSERVSPRTRAAIRLEPRPSGDILVSAASWVGGVPRVPRDFRWPHLADRPLTFLAQINLADLSPAATAGLLPKQGVLLFFFGDAPDSAEDIGNDHFLGRVLFLDANDCNALQAQHPPRSSAEESLTASRAQSFIPFVDIPFTIEVDRVTGAELPSHAEALYSDIRQYLGQGGRPVLTDCSGMNGFSRSPSSIAPSRPRESR